jgi:hypothetical protein
MSKVSRADWSPAPTWDEIRNKPTVIGVPGPRGATGSTGPAGPPGAPGVLPAPVQILWDVPSVLPLQSVYEDFPVIGAVPGSPVAHGVAFDPGFCLTFAYVITNDTVRLKVVNMDIVAVDLPSALWNLQFF